jgi:hypothetical protein
MLQHSQQQTIALLQQDRARAGRATSAAIGPNVSGNRAERRARDSWARTMAECSDSTSRMGSGPTRSISKIGNEFDQ